MTPIELVSWDAAKIRLRAPNSYVRWWFEKHYLEALEREVRELGSEARVEFDLDAETVTPPILEAAVPAAAIPARGSGAILVIAPPPSPSPSPSPSPPPRPVVISNGENDLQVLEAATLNPRYTFDTFVAGPSNQLAFAASQAAASSYPPKYNPVFVCGGVGLGSKGGELGELDTCRFGVVDACDKQRVQQFARGHGAGELVGLVAGLMADLIADCSG